MAGHPAIFYYLCTRFQEIILGSALEDRGR